MGNQCSSRKAGDTCANLDLHKIMQGATVWANWSFWILFKAVPRALYWSKQEVTRQSVTVSRAYWSRKGYNWCATHNYTNHNCHLLLKQVFLMYQVCLGQCNLSKTKDGNFPKAKAPQIQSYSILLGFNYRHNCIQLDIFLEKSSEDIIIHHGVWKKGLI